MHRKLTITFLFAILFAFAPQNSHAQTSCGDVTPVAATAIDCTSATDAALNISGGARSVVTDVPAVTVKSARGSATLTSYGANVATTQTGGDTIVIGGATAAAFQTDDGSFTAKNGTGGNVVTISTSRVRIGETDPDAPNNPATITAGTGDVNIGVHNTSRVKIGGTGGNGIIATSTSGNVVADFSNQGIIVSDRQGTNGLIANTAGGDIELSFEGMYSAIHLYGARSGTGKEYTVRDTRGATLTSTGGGDITVELINGAAIFASSVGDSHGLAADTGGAGNIDITIANAVSCIVGKDGIIANTVSGNIDLALANGVVYGRGGGSTEGGNGVIATSTSGDINIGGNGGSAIFADKAGSIAIEASTTGTGTLSVVAGEADGLSVWTNGGFAAINASTVNVVDADIGGNGSNYAILATGDVDVSGADVWTNKTGAATISTTTGAVNVWNGSKVRATGATANAISATTVVVNGSEVWTEGNTSNSIVAETVNFSNDAKVWSNASGSSAISAKTGGGVTVVSEDGKGEVWSNASESSTVKATTTAGIHGLKVWSNGAGSQAVTAATVTINGSATEVWSNGDTSDTIIATGTANIWNGAKVWSNGVTSNTVVAETLNVSNGGKVWANGAGSSAVSSGTSGTANIISEDGTGEIWTISGVSTVTAATAAYINDGVKVWANGAASRAVTAGTSATVNNTDVWTTEGGSSDTIVAPTVNIWNGAKVWANGTGSNAIVAETANISKDGKVWTNGVRSSAVSAGTSGTVNIVSEDGDGEIWTTVGGVSTVKATTAAYINDGLKVWANGSDSNTVKAASATVNGTGTQVWSEGQGGRTIDATTANIWNGAKVWANGSASNSVVAGTVNVSGGGKVWAEGADSSAVSAGGSGTVNIISADGDGEVWTTVDGVSTVKATAAAYINDGLKVWSNGAASRTVSAATATVDGGASVWADKERSTAIDATDVNIYNGAQVWSNGATSNAVTAQTVNVSGGGKIWVGETGPSSSAVRAGTSETVTIVSEDGMGEIWSSGIGASTVNAATSVTVHDLKVFANGQQARAIFTATATVNGAQIWTEDNTSDTIIAATVNVSGGGKVWANGDGSAAVEAGTSETVTIVSEDGMGEIWTIGAGGSTINASSLSGGSATVHDLKVWANGAASNAVSAETVTANGSDIWTEGATSDAIRATTANIWNGANVWANGDTSNAVRAVTVTVNGANVWTEGNTSETITAETVMISNEAKVWTNGISDSNAIKATSATINNSEVWAEGAINTGAVITVATTVDIVGGAKVWTNNSNGVTVLATTATVNGSDVWANGVGGVTIVAETVEVSGGANVWIHSGDGGAAIKAEKRTADTTEITVDVNGASVWANGSVSTAISSYEAGVELLINAVSANIRAGGLGASAISADAFFGNAAINISGSNISAWGSRSRGINVTSYGGANATVNATGANVWTEDTISTAITVTADLGGNAALFVKDSDVWANEISSKAIYADATKLPNSSGTNSVVFVGIDDSTVRTAKRFSTGLEIRASRGISLASAEINGTDITTAGADSTAVIVHSQFRGHANASFTSSNIRTSGRNSTGLSVAIQDGGGVPAIDGWRYLCVVFPNGREVYCTNPGTPAIPGGRTFVDLSVMDISTGGNESNAVYVAALEGGNGIVNAVRVNIWAEGDNSSGVAVQTVEDIDAGREGHAIVNLDKSKVWANGSHSAAINAFSESETGNGLVTVTASDVWTEGHNSVAVNGYTYLYGKTDIEVRGSKVWANGANSAPLFLITEAGGTSFMDVHDSTVWTEGDNSTAFGGETIQVKGGGNKIQANFNGVTILVNGADSAAFTLNAQRGDIGVQLHNSAVILANSTGEFFKLTDSSGTRISVDSTNTSFRMGEDDATVFATTVTSGGAANMIDDTVRTFRMNIRNQNEVSTEGLRGTVFSLDHQTGAAVEINNYFNAKRAWTQGADGNTIVLKSSAGGDVSYDTGVSSKIWANGAGSSAIWSESGGGSLSISAAEGETMEIWSAGDSVNTVRTDSPDIELRNLKVRANGARANALWAETATPAAMFVAIHNSQIGAGRASVAEDVNAAHISSGGDSENIDIEINGSDIWAGGGRSNAVVANAGGGSVAVSINGSNIWANETASSAIFAFSSNTETGDNAIVVKVNSSKIWTDATRDSNAIRARTTAGRAYVEISDSDIFENSTRTSTPARSSAVFMNMLGAGGGNVVVSGSNIRTTGRGGSGIRTKTTTSLTSDSYVSVANGSNVWATGQDGSALLAESHRFMGIEINGSNMWSTGQSRATAVSQAHSGGDRSRSTEWTVTNGSKVWANGARTGAIFMNSRAAQHSNITINDKSQVWTEGDGARSVYGNAILRSQFITVGNQSHVWANGAGSVAIYANSIDGGFNDELQVIVNQSSSVFTTKTGNGIFIETEAFGNIVVHGNSRVFANGAKSNAILIGGRVGVTYTRVSGGSQVYTTANDSHAMAVVDGFYGFGSTISIDSGARVFTNGARSVAVNINSYDRIGVVNVNAADVYTTGADSTTILIEEKDDDPNVGESEAELHMYNGANVSASGMNSVAVSLRSGSYARYQSLLRIFEGALLCGGVIDENRNCIVTPANNVIALQVGDEWDNNDVGLDNWGTIVGKVTLSDVGDTFTNKDTGLLTIIGSFDTGDGDDIFTNEGTFIGNASMGADDDEVYNEDTGTITIITSFDTGSGSDIFQNRGTINGAGSVIHDSSDTVTGLPPSSSPPPSSQSAPAHGAQSTPSEGGGNRFRLSSATPEREPERATINFGEGDDHFINEGTIVLAGAGGFNGLDKITFGANSTLVVSADPEEMTGKPLINLEGTISAEDIEGFRVRVDVPGTHITEYTIFEADDLPDGEERQEVVERLNAEIGERGSVQTDGDGNLFLTAMSLKDASLDIYDSLIQSAYRADRSFATKLSSGCGYGSAASDEIDGDFWTGCVWATSGGRYTRYSSAINYDEDVYTFTGGVSAPFNSILVSVAGGYEISNLDMDVLTDEGRADASGEATRFMGGIFASTIVDRYMVDGRFQYVSTSWESTRTAGDNRYSADTNATVFGGALGAAMPFLSGSFALFPRIEIGASYVTAGAFDETSLTNTPEAIADAFKVKDTSEILVYVSPSFEARSPLSETVNMRIRVGADIHVLNPEADLEATLADGNVPRSGGQDRIMFNYGAGFEYTPYAPLRELSVRIDYDGGMSTSFDTFVQQFRGGVNYSF